MLKWLKDGREFWGPVVFALGITFLINGITQAIKYAIGSPPFNGGVALTLVIFEFIIVAILFYLSIKLMKFNKEFALRTLFTSCFSILLAGMNNYFLSSIAGFVLIIIALVFLVVGLGLFAFRK